MFPVKTHELSCFMKFALKKTPIQEACHMKV